MYAVIKTGGKQYRVSAGEKLKVEQIPADIGATISFNEVLAVGAGADLVFGTPLVSGAKVDVTVVDHGRGEKVRIFKMRRRKHYQRHGGHRQNFTEVFISAIYGANGAQISKADAPIISAPVAQAAAAVASTAAVAAVAAPAKRAAKVRGKAKDGSDDIELIEGVGPKIAGLLRDANLGTFEAISKASIEQLKAALEAGGPKFNIAKPDTWAEQAALAAKGDWAAFDKLTEELVGGVRK
ncbi:MAG: 50S ribosomal protein L21 [Betaproteobacteria bacterium]|nr:MAG: 50S ribosomal protein L21 [Betaproteobacteria bacterium]